MIAELILASLFTAAGGPEAYRSAPPPEDAVIRPADTGHDTSRHPAPQQAADLGCQRRYGHRDGYDRDCYERRGDPYHENGRDRYGRYGDDSYDDGRYGGDDERYEEEYGRRDRDYGRYDERGDGYDGEAYRGYRDIPRDRLHDRYGRPYSPPQDRGRPPYRSGGYDDPRPGNGYYDRRGYRDEPRRGFSRGERRFDPYRESGGPDYRLRPERGYLHLIHYRERPNDNGLIYKKKDTTVMTTTTDTGTTTTATSDMTTTPRPAGFDAGSTV